MSEWKEADITINGYFLTTAQAMTLRVALESFAGDLRENGLGDDEHGKRMLHSYTTNIHAIRNHLYLKD